MAEWFFEGERYKSVPVDWNTLSHEDLKASRCVRRRKNEFVDYLVYNKKYDKCYWLEAFGIFGGGSKVKLYVSDVYAEKSRFPYQHYWFTGKEFEIVVKDKN